MRALATAPLAEWLHRLHPMRLQYEMVSDANPFVAMLSPMAGWVHEHRKPVSADNPFLALQESFSRQVVAALDAFRDLRDGLSEATFLTVYGSPAVQAWFGIDPSLDQRLRKAGKSALHRELVQRRIAELKARIPVGGLREAVIRALIYVGLPRAAVDERGFEAVRRVRQAHEDMPALPLSEFKALVREQYFMLLIDPEAAIAALPSLLPEDMETRGKALAVIRQVLAAPGGLSRVAEARMQQIARMFAPDGDAAAAPGLAVVAPAESGAVREAS